MELQLATMKNRMTAIHQTDMMVCFSRFSVVIVALLLEAYAAAELTVTVCRWLAHDFHGHQLQVATDYYRGMPSLWFYSEFPKCQ